MYDQEPAANRITGKYKNHDGITDFSSLLDLHPLERLSVEGGREGGSRVGDDGRGEGGGLSQRRSNGTGLGRREGGGRRRGGGIAESAATRRHWRRRERRPVEPDV